HGRGSVLTVDLTNRCNIMCDPCVMDANQVGFGHELTWEEVKEILDNALKIKPRRQMSVQLSGGEPTMSPYFIDAVRYARKLGYNSVQAATNGIEFAKSKEFCRRAFEAGLRYAYLQFDGVGNDVKNQHGITEPTRDWFPISLMGAFADFADLVHGPEAQWGQVSCGCHPNCGVGTALMVNKENNEWAPVPQFLDIPGLVGDIQKITDAGRGKVFSNLMMGLALLKNYKPFKAPPSLALVDLLKKFDKSFALTGDERAKKNYGSSGPERTYQDTLKRRSDPWHFLFIVCCWCHGLIR